MTKWIRVGLVYGFMGLSIGIIVAAIRTIVLFPCFGEALGTGIEILLSGSLITASGLWLMRNHGGWTTNSAIYFGGTGALAYLLLTAPVNFFVLGHGAAMAVQQETLTHGNLFPLALVIMSLGPAVLTQRA